MTDIVEKLRMDADNASPYCIDQDSIMEAADTIESLRQRVKELDDELHACEVKWNRVTGKFTKNETK